MTRGTNQRRRVVSRVQLLRIVVATICLIATAWADTSMVTGSGLTYQIDDQHSGALTAPNNFQSWPLLCVKDCADCNDPCTANDLYDASGANPELTLNGQQIRLGQDFLADVLVQRQIYVPSAGGKF